VPVLLLFFWGMAIMAFFMSIAIHFLRIEKMLRNTFIKTELKVKYFLENG
jgi:hypothetical protein